MQLNSLVSLFIVLISNLDLFGQGLNNLNGYKYVYFPPLTYQNGEVDTYGIGENTRNYFAEKGFQTLVNNNNLPSEVTDNLCLILTCSIEHPAPKQFNNAVTITLTNCKNEIVYKTKGAGSMGSDIDGDYRIAVRKALKEFNSMTFRYSSDLTPEIEYPKVESTSETEGSLKSYFDTNKLDAIEGIYKSYQSQKTRYYKFAIKKREDKFIAIILESESKIWKLGEVKAYFEPSSLSGLYSVKWYMNNKIPFETFGSIESEALLMVEFKDEKGDKRQDKFIKMYPAEDHSAVSSKKVVGVSGSGFFVSTNGLIATNAHVIDEAKSIEVIISNEIGIFSFKAKVVLKDNKNDVAILQIDDEKFKSLNSIPYGITEKADIGEKAFTIGYPLNDIMGTNYKVTDGIISAKSGIGDDIRYYQISVPLQPGNSGGPLFNKEGNVIGIVSSKLNSNAIGTSIENVNYAVKSTYLLSIINMIPDASAPLVTTQPASKELQDQVKILKNYVCLIRATY